MLKVIYDGHVVATKDVTRSQNHTVGTIKAATCAGMKGGPLAPTDVIAYNKHGLMVEDHAIVRSLPIDLAQPAAESEENSVLVVYMVLMPAEPPRVKEEDIRGHGAETVRVGEMAAEVSWTWGTTTGFADEGTEFIDDGYHTLPLGVFAIICKSVTSPVLLMDMRAVCRGWRDHIDSTHAMKRFLDNGCKQKCVYDAGASIAQGVHEAATLSVADATLEMVGEFDIFNATAEERRAYHDAKRQRIERREEPFYHSAVTRCVRKTCCAFPSPVDTRGALKIVQLAMYPLLTLTTTPSSHLKGVAHVLRLYLAGGRAPHGMVLDGPVCEVDCRARFVRVAQTMLPSTVYVKCVTTHYAIFCDNDVCYEAWMDEDAAYHVCKFNVARAHAALRALRYVLWESADLYCNTCRFGKTKPATGFRMTGGAGVSINFFL